MLARGILTFGRQSNFLFYHCASVLAVGCILYCSQVTKLWHFGTFAIGAVLAATTACVHPTRALRHFLMIPSHTLYYIIASFVLPARLWQIRNAPLQFCPPHLFEHSISVVW